MIDIRRSIAEVSRGSWWLGKTDCFASLAMTRREFWYCHCEFRCNRGEAIGDDKSTPAIIPLRMKLQRWF